MSEAFGSCADNSNFSLNHFFSLMDQLPRGMSKSWECMSGRAAGVQAGSGHRGRGDGSGEQALPLPGRGLFLHQGPSAALTFLFSCCAFSRITVTPGKQSVVAGLVIPLFQEDS